MMQPSLPLELVPELSQWFTEDYLANLIGLKVREHFWGDKCRILEPHAGSGQLVKGLLRAGFRPDQIVANEIDHRLAKRLRADPELMHVDVRCGDARALDFPRDQFDVVVMNSPFENGQDVEWLRDILFFAPVVYAVVRSELEHLVSADQEVFSKSSVTWRAKCVGRPKFVGDGNEDGKKGGQFEASVIRLDRGIVAHGCVRVQEERWRRP